MRTAAAAAAIGREFLARPGRALLIVACTAISAFFAGAAAHAVAYLRTEVDPALAAMFPPSRLVVRPAEASLAFFKVETGSITPELIDEVRGWPEASAVFPQAPAEFPVMAEIEIGRMGRGFQSDVVIHGVPAGLIAPDGATDDGFRWDGDGSVPVYVSAYFLDLYNLGLAESASLPKLTADAAIGREFDIVLGRSSFNLPAAAPPERVRARIAGLTVNPYLVGIVAPYETVMEWNSRFSVNPSGNAVLLHVDAVAPEEADAIRGRLRDEGFTVDSTGEELERLRGVMLAVEGAVAGAAALIGVLALVGVWSTVLMSARERRPGWGLMRATGMRPATLVLLLGGEALVLAGVAGGVALVVFAGMLGVLRGAVGETLGGLSALPGDPLALGGAAPAAVFAFAVAMVGVPMLVAGIRAVVCEPVRLIQERSL